MDWSLVTIFAFVLALVGMRSWFGLQRGRSGSGLAATDQGALDRALEQAARLEARIDTLERILDDDMPGWRRRGRA